MSRIGTYGFINAKVRAMRSLLLTEPVYRTMMQARTLNDLMTILSQIPQYDSLESTASSPIGVEHFLMMEEVRRLRVIEKYTQGEVRAFIALLLERLDGERLKSILRLWHRKADRVPPPLDQKIITDFPVKEMLAAPDLSGLMDTLAGTPLQSALMRRTRSFDEKTSVFLVEIAIDQEMVDRLWEATGRLPRKDRDLARRLLGLEIDLKNVEAVERFRKYYSMTPRVMSEVLLPHGYRIGEGKMRALVSGGSVLDALTDIAGKSRSIFTGGEHEGSGLESIERFLYRMMWENARRAFGQFPFSIASILGYLALMRIETRNIRTIVNSKVYGLTPEATEAFLVM